MKQEIRNIGIIAHIDAGKTTTTERILFYTGKIHRIGEVDSGSATMDWMEQEQDRGITIVAAATTCHWQYSAEAKQQSIQINLIDTPGHVDFTAEVERSLSVLDGAIAILCAVKGIEPQTETVWRQSQHYHIPRLVYVNKMDRAGADFAAALEQLRTKFGARPLPLYLPIGAEGGYTGNIDVLRQEELYFAGNSGETVQRRPLAEEHRPIAQAAYEEMINLLSESEDQIAELYLEGRDIPEELCHQVIRRLCLSREIIPVCVGSSLKNKGIQPLLDAVALYLPSPNDVPALSVPLLKGRKSREKGTVQTSQIRKKAQKRKDKKELVELAELTADASAHLAALVFKVQYKKEMGLLCFVRVYSGTLKANSSVLNVRKGKHERINRLILTHADSHNPVSELKAGEIGVIVGFKLAQTGDTICEDQYQVLLEPMDFPEPVISIAIELESGADGDKMRQALANLEREDPTFRVEESSDTGQILLSGMGELHLEVLCTRLRDEYKLQFRTGSPRVTHRESLAQKVSGVGSFEHEIAGTLYEVKVELDLEPYEAPEQEMAGTEADEHLDKQQEATGNYFESQCPELSRELNELARDAVLRNLQSGFRYGYPAIHIRTVLKSCRYNTEEPYLPAVEAAIAHAIDSAVAQSEILLLEPIMKVTIITPAEYVGDVIRQLTQRSGQVHRMDSQANFDTIRATAPLSQLFGYSTVLRSQTQGRGTFSLEFDHFAVKP